jgi:hypothetical protein
MVRANTLTSYGNLTSQIRVDASTLLQTRKLDGNHVAWRNTAMAIKLTLHLSRFTSQPRIDLKKLHPPKNNTLLDSKLNSAMEHAERWKFTAASALTNTTVFGASELKRGRYLEASSLNSEKSVDDSHHFPNTKRLDMSWRKTLASLV